MSQENKKKKIISLKFSYNLIQSVFTIKLSGEFEYLQNILSTRLNIIKYTCIVEL